MNSKKLPLIVMITVPWLILLGMVIKAYLPIVTGKVYLLPVTLKDPRDFFRGNYVALRYDFSQLDLKKTSHNLTRDRQYRYGDTLYLELHDTGGLLKITGLFTENKPDSLMLRVTPETPFRANEGVANLVAGLESYFAPQQAAVEWEKAILKNNVLARVYIDRNGNARITGLAIQNHALPASKRRANE